MTRRLTLAVALAAALAACGGADTTKTMTLGASTGVTCPAGSTLTYDTFGKTFLSTYCTSCHSGVAPAGGHDWTNVANVRANVKMIDLAAGSGPSGTFTTMPAGNGPIPAIAEREQLSEWLACGAP